MIAFPIAYVFLRIPAGIHVTYHGHLALLPQQIESVQSPVRIFSFLASQGIGCDENRKSAACKYPVEQMDSCARLTATPTLTCGTSRFLL